MLTCRDATRLMSEEQERHLTVGERAAVRMHNLMCRGCSNYRKHIAFIRRAAKVVREGDTT